MKPYYQQEGITIYHGDCRDVLPTLPKVDLILTDPPYGIQYNTDSSRFVRKPSAWWGETSTKHSNNSPRVNGDDKPFDPSPFINQRSILWGANHYADKIPPSGGWLVWDKRLGVEQVAEKGWPLSEAELAWTNIRGSVRVFRNRWMGLLRSEEQGEYYHPTQKPVALMRWCLLLAKDKSVLDPFMGSGTTLVAAKDLGIQAIGIELEERYCEVAANRLRQGVLFGAEPCKPPSH